MSISRGIPAGEPVARLLTREQARRIAANIAKLPAADKRGVMRVQPHNS
jgi:hypothetical protein